MRTTIFRDFIRLESSGGIVLICAAILALLFANSPWQNYYQSWISLPIGSQSFAFWLNEGLMTIFFLLVSLEIKREIIIGSLNTLDKAILPAVAAVGGMIAPAVIYLLINGDNSVAVKGWGIPTATDIAFSLAIVALLNRRVPVTLKVLLTAIAIFDDLGAIIIIALFYTLQISYLMLLASLFFVLLLYILNRFGITRLVFFLGVGSLLWLCLLKSGLHPTLAGVATAFAIPVEQTKRLEKKIHPWVIYGILPLFAFVNAGVSLANPAVVNFKNTIVLGIVCGLFFGKQLGIMAASFLAIRLKICQLPKGVSYPEIYAISITAGVGFTMSLFIGNLAFGALNLQIADVRYGVLMGSLISGFLGYLVLRIIYRTV